MASFDGLTVLFVGDLNFSSNSYSRLKTFRSLGARVREFSHTPIEGEADQTSPSLRFRIAWKLGFHPDRAGANRWLVKEAAREPPALVWIEKGNMISPKTLRRLRDLCPGAILASYSDDDMYNWSNRTWAYTKGLCHYDAVFTTKSYNAEPGELPRLGARRVIMVDKAYDADHHRPQELDDEERGYLSTDVGFIGSYENERAETMRYLARHGIAVRIWGNGWDRFGSNDEGLIVERRPLINTSADASYSKAISATKINLAFLRKANRDLQTDRSIEIPACGGFMVAEYSVEHAQLFEEDKEAVFFRSRDELLEKVRYYLTHETERHAVAAAGLERCRTSGYSHKDRVIVMLNALFAEGMSGPS